MIFKGKTFFIDNNLLKGGNIIINNEIKELNKKLKEIKEKGWIKSQSKGSGGAGRTLENLLHLPKNEFEIPDYKNIEIKTKKENSMYYTTLFNANPIGPGFSETIRIKNFYGWNSRNFKNKKVFNASIWADRSAVINKKWKMNITIFDSKEEIHLIIRDLNNNLIENKVYWTFDQLKEKLERKLSILAYIEYKKQTKEKIDYFAYCNIHFYKLTSFEKFLELIKNGEIRISFKVGVYYYGIKKGQTFDHGTGFEIKPGSLDKLFQKI